MKKTLVATTLTLCTLLYGCSEQASAPTGGWTAEIHPDAANPADVVLVGEFPSYEACMEAAIEALGGDGVFNCSAS
jgi:hypothetical protein